MLETLRQYNRKEVERILSSLTSELLPNPEIYVRAALGVEPELHSRVWNEIRRRVKVDPSDASPASRGKLFEFLFSEMSQRALPQSTLESVKARLSLRGELRSDLYDIRFSPAFRVSQAHGVRPNHVREAIRNANDAEHLNLLDGEVLLSLFLRIADPAARDSYALLVVALRVAHDLEVSTAFRIYRSDVDFSAAQRPLDILRLFVSKYGFPITVGHVTSKLIIDETTTIAPPIDPNTSVKVHALEGANIYSDMLIRKRGLHNSYGVAYAFALDQATYASDLRKHGVHVERLEFQQPHLYSR